MSMIPDATNHQFRTLGRPPTSSWTTPTFLLCHLLRPQHQRYNLRPSRPPLPTPVPQPRRLPLPPLGLLLRRRPHPRFAALAPYLAGALVLRQDPVECLFQFLCSSNNNIARITKMVANLSSLGGFLGSAGAFDFFEFPSLERLELVSEQELRQSGFGYRAKYIVGSVKALQGKPGEVHIGLLPRENWRFPR